MTARALLLLAGAVAAWIMPGEAAQAGSAAYKLLKLDRQFVKWGAPQLGMPALITYAYADGPITDESARNCKSMDRLDAAAARSGLSVSDMTAAAEAAFRLWEKAGGVVFEKTDAVDRANIVIGAQTVPRGYAFTNVHKATGAPRTVSRERNSERGLGSEDREAVRPSGETTAQVAPISRSAICINPERTWKLGHDGDLKVYDLSFTFAHEIGHAIGLDHPGRKGEVMYFKYSEDFDGLQAGDISGIVRLYGPPASSN
ncbi:matrixin family metalloprotease [Roseibium aggregatum]|uniref:Matrixin family metalloprotease n=1 Tax=Roseibium aggregatum TaxID=187304 RepID=A0A926NYW7_9HYPH|nr:matrixin family metalloprotease [Roseibium aggregatum]MBD1547919.1 matrixin family metalloprotease [Roseibium aggregatum]